MYLENYISEDLGNTTIQVLSGKVKVELVERKRNITLEIGDRIQVWQDAFLYQLIKIEIQTKRKHWDSQYYFFSTKVC